MRAVMPRDHSQLPTRIRRATILAMDPESDENPQQFREIRNRMLSELGVRECVFAIDVIGLASNSIGNVLINGWVIMQESNLSTINIHAKKERKTQRWRTSVSLPIVCLSTTSVLLSP